MGVCWENQCVHHYAVPFRPSAHLWIAGEVSLKSHIVDVIAHNCSPNVIVQLSYHLLVENITVFIRVAVVLSGGYKRAVKHL